MTLTIDPEILFAVIPAKLCSASQAELGPNAGRAENKMALAIEHMIDACLEYGAAYTVRFEGSTIAEDYVLGEEIANTLKAARGLLNGPLGVADGGTMDRRILNAAQHLGFNTEEW
jgi:hypothetical protein